MQQSNKRVVIATIGTFLEWAEFTYYAYIASKIASLFFPNLSPNLALMATFSVFALSYFFRPMGALFFGYMGDKQGRRRALQVSIMIMGFSSVIIGCLPTYHDIGLAAPILLLIFRSIQGFAVSGEFNGSAIYLIEHDTHTPYRAGSWTGFASALGMMLGSLMSVVIYLPHMPTWAWRIPFLLGALSCFCAAAFRNNLSESPAFLMQKPTVSMNPLRLLFTHHKKPLAKAMLLITAIGVYLYIMSIYYGTHLLKYTTLSPTETKWIVTFGQALVVVFIALIAKYADKYNGKKLLKMGFIGFFIATPIVYLVPMTDSFLLILIAQIGYALCDAIVSVPLFKILNDLFPVHVRYSGVSVSWSMSMALFGGTAPLVANYLQQIFNNPIAPVFYIFLTTSLALLALRRDVDYAR
jgi:MHS family proline/betaine transporter-like MFS transporter